jgi:glycosyltransferase EpsD
LDFIRAAAIVAEDYPQVQFLIAGEGSLRPECESLINELNLQDKFFLLGFRNDIDRIMPILTFTVMSSLWEGLPVAFQEAMSAGKPIIANDVDGASDAIVDHETGYLVTPHQPQEMAERILFLLKNDELCYEMGLTAQQYSERFSGQRMVAEVESLYRELFSTCNAKSTLSS